MSCAPLDNPRSWAITAGISTSVTSRNSGMSRGYFAPGGCLPATALAARPDSSKVRATGSITDVRASFQTLKWSRTMPAIATCNFAGYVGANGFSCNGGCVVVPLVSKVPIEGRVDTNLCLEERPPPNSENVNEVLTRPSVSRSRRAAPVVQNKECAIVPTVVATPAPMADFANCTDSSKMAFASPRRRAAAGSAGTPSGNLRVRTLAMGRAPNLFFRRVSALGFVVPLGSSMWTYASFPELSRS